MTKALCCLIAGSIALAAAPAGFAISGVDSPPPPAAPHEISFVKPKETRLENGLRVIVAERPGLPLLAAQLLVLSGAEVESDELAGAASMTGALLTKGTEKMSAPEIARAIESLGGSISSGAGWDASTATVVVGSNNAEPALAILSDVVLHPTFKQEEIDRLKNQTLDDLRVALEQPGSLARYVCARVIFGAGAYGHASDGTLETVQTIRRDDIVKLYQTYYAPDNAALVFAGDITLDQAKSYAQEFFGDWKTQQAVSAHSQRPATADWRPQNVVVDMPQAGQAAVSAVKPGIKRDSPDFYVGLVANSTLGTGFNSRLNQEIRIKRGLSYGAGSALEARREVGPFVARAQTKNESAAEVAHLLQGELKRLGTEPVQGEELKSRQAVLTGGYARNMETNLGVAGQIASLAIHKLPLDTLDKFIPSINAVSTEDITAFAAKHFGTPASLVIVGKAPAFLDAVKKDFPDVKVIAQADLDLNRAELTKAK